MNLTSEKNSNTRYSLSDSIRLLKLSRRAERALAISNVETIKDLMILSKSNISNNIACGEGTVKEIFEAIKEIKSKLAENEKLEISLKDSIESICLSTKMQKSIHLQSFVGEKIKTVADFIFAEDYIFGDDLLLEQIETRNSLIKYVKEKDLPLIYKRNYPIACLNMSDNLRKLLGKHGVRQIGHLFLLNANDFKEFRLYDNEIEELKNIIANVNKNLVEVSNEEEQTKS